MKKLTIILIFICSLSFGQSVVTNNAGTSAISSNDGSSLVISFDPSGIDNLIAWYDSKDLTTITQVSTFVSEWADKSGNGYHLTQASGTYQPIYSADNGIVFDGTNDYLITSFGSTYNQPYTVIMVLEQRTTETISTYFNNNSATPLIGRATGDNIRVNAGTNNIFFTKSGIFGKVIFVADINGASSNFYENNIQKGTTANVGTESLIGVQIGRESTGTFYSDINYYELIIYNKVLTASEMTLINNYLNNKYNVY